MKINDIQYVRIILTNNCNFACNYCHKEGCKNICNDIDSLMLIRLMHYLYSLGYRKVKLMGGEPMLYDDIETVVKGISQMGDDIDLSMVSNGSVPYERYYRLFEIGLHRVNISVHGWTPNYFINNTGSSIKICNEVKQNIIALSEKGMLGKINYVLKKNKNEEDFFKLIDFVQENNLMIDVLNLLETTKYENIKDLQYSFGEIERLIQSRYIVKSETLYENVYSLPSKHLFLDGGGIINLKISEMNQQRLFRDCIQCHSKSKCIEGIKAIRITNDLFLQPCLLREDNTLDLKTISDETKIKEYLLAL